MTVAMRKAHLEMPEGLGEDPKPSLCLIRVLEGVEREAAPREKSEVRPMPGAERTPRPFAYD